MKKNDTKDYADLLRQLETKRLTKGTKSVEILVMLCVKGRDRREE